MPEIGPNEIFIIYDNEGDEKFKKRKVIKRGMEGKTYGKIVRWVFG